MALCFRMVVWQIIYGVNGPSHADVQCAAAARERRCIRFGRRCPLRPGVLVRPQWIDNLAWNQGLAKPGVDCESFRLDVMPI
jgi:hypothetical protein